MIRQFDRSAATIADILGAARKLFAGEGFDATSIDDIAAKAGVAKGAVYHHFDSKEEIFTRVLEDVQAEIAALPVPAATRAMSDPLDQIAAETLRYLLAATEPSRKRILLIDGPAVIGWQKWREIDDRFFGAGAKAAMTHVLSADASPREVGSATHLMMGAVMESMPGMRHGAGCKESRARPFRRAAQNAGRPAPLAFRFRTRHASANTTGGNMLSWQIGDVKITRVVESELPVPHKYSFLQQATPEALREMEWLYPHFVTPEGAMVLSIHALLVDAPGMKLVVDTCIGNDKPRALLRGQKLQTKFLEHIADAGFAREKVDAVVCTHLHVDHVGWNTMKDGDKWVPTFPNARAT